MEEDTWMDGKQIVKEYLLNEDNFRNVLFTKKAYDVSEKELIDRFVANNNKLSDYSIGSELILTNFGQYTKGKRIYVCKTVSIINLN
jgi:hypothetical protein